LATLGLVLVWLSLFIAGWGMTDFHTVMPTSTSPAAQHPRRRCRAYFRFQYLSAHSPSWPPSPQFRLSESSLQKLRVAIIVLFAHLAAWHPMTVWDLNGHLERNGLASPGPGAYLGVLGYLVSLLAFAGGRGASADASP
jgi:hypothetical protein